jgi:hypothetical protein
MSGSDERAPGYVNAGSWRLLAGRRDDSLPAALSQNAGKATGGDDDQRAALPRRVDAYALRCVLRAAEPDRLSEAFLLLRVEGPPWVGFYSRVASARGTA